MKMKSLFFGVILACASFDVRMVLGQVLSRQDLSMQAGSELEIRLDRYFTVTKANSVEKYGPLYMRVSLCDSKGVCYKLTELPNFVPSANQEHGIELGLVQTISASKFNYAISKTGSAVGMKFELVYASHLSNFPYQNKVIQDGSGTLQFYASSRLPSAGFSERLDVSGITAERNSNEEMSQDRIKVSVSVRFWSPAEVAFRKRSKVKGSSNGSTRSVH
jgi:hypothetical protein